MKGSESVFIGGLPAARQTDLTGHGGVIVLGCPTVFIGGMALLIPATFAIATKKPTAEELQAIKDAIAAKDQQKAIDLAVQSYGIDVSNVPGGPQWEPTQKNYGTTAFSGEMQIGPAALKSPEILASTLVHETTHANQAAAVRAEDPTATDWPASNDATNYDEAGAYASELHSAENTGLDTNKSEHGLAKARRKDHYNKLPKSNQTDFDNGKYPP